MRTHTHTHTHTRTHVHAHAQTHTHTHARARAHTHIHTHIIIIIITIINIITIKPPCLPARLLPGDKGQRTKSLSTMPTHAYHGWYLCRGRCVHLPALTPPIITHRPLSSSAQIVGTCVFYIPGHFIQNCMRPLMFLRERGGGVKSSQSSVQHTIKNRNSIACIVSSRPSRTVIKNLINLFLIPAPLLPPHPPPPSIPDRRR